MLTTDHHRSILVQGRRVLERAQYVLAGAFILTAAVVLYVLDPREAGNYPVCPFLGVTGYHCPGCGTLRALHQLLYGNPINALGYNLLTVLSLPFMGYAFAVGAMRAFRAPAPRPLFVNSKLIWGLVLRCGGILGSAERASRADVDTRSLANVQIGE